MTEPTPHTWDPYLFGGSIKQIRRTQQRFVHYFACGPVLDIGCGRGLFMDMLRKARVGSVGIDLYPAAVEACRARGLEAYVADALDWLPGHREEYRGIFCSHVIEHLPFERANQLVKSCAAALQPGGRVIFVTPNPHDLNVIGETFWLDPTHVRPYPLPLMQSMLREAGLEVIGGAVFHGGLPKRELLRAALDRLRFGSFSGHPNAYVVGQKPE